MAAKTSKSTSGMSPSHDARSPKSSSSSEDGNSDNDSSDISLQGYKLPIGYDAELGENFSLSYASPIGKKVDRMPQVNRKEDGRKPHNMHHHWRARRATLRPGVNTELLTINVAEGLIDEKKNTSITLYCDNNALGKETATPRSQMHWLCASFLHLCLCAFHANWTAQARRVYGKCNPRYQSALDPYISQRTRRCQ